MAKLSTDWTVLKMLEWATVYFEQKGVRNPRFSIEWLLAHVLQRKRLDLYLLFDRPLTSDELNQVRPMVKRRALHEPLQYITGETNFFGYPIQVQPGVLIPRPETEQLVELVLNNESFKKDASVLDIGTGSGCIPIALKKQRPEWNISAVDISEDALVAAKSNAIKNEVEIEYSLEDLFNPSEALHDRTFDIIVSNPPYVLETEFDSLDIEVKKFEPELALFTSTTEKIFGAIQILSSKILSSNGLLFLEINERFGRSTAQIFERENWNVTLIKDYSKKDRFILAKKAKKVKF